MKEVIEYLVKSIVKMPEAVSVTQQNVEGSTVYTIKVDDSEMGLIIGKQGKTIRSLRDLANAKAIKDNVRIRIELIESEQPTL